MALHNSIGLISDNKRSVSISVNFPETSKILKRIADNDKTAVNDCLNEYGNLVWCLTKKHTGNEDEAEIAVQEIFLDIWKYAVRFDETKTDEATFISHIACRNLNRRNFMNVV